MDGEAKNQDAATTELAWRETIHNTDQNDDLSVDKQDKQVRSFDAVRVKYINMDSIKSVIFTKLESTTRQRLTNTVYKVYTGANGNLMPLQILKNLFPKVTIEHFHATKKKTNNNVALNTYNKSNREQLGICTVKLRHKDRT